MSRLFVVCPGCHRHTYASERRCPFCATTLIDPARPGVGAALALSTTLLAGACDNATPSPAAPPPVHAVPVAPTPPAPTPPPQAPPPLPDAATAPTATDASMPSPDVGEVRDAGRARRSTTRRPPRRPPPESRVGMDYGIFESPMKKVSPPDDPDDRSRE